MPNTLSSKIGIDIGQRRLVLRGDGSVYMPSEQTLFAADFHLGKDASFRSAGIPVPTEVNEGTLLEIDQAVRETNARHLVVLGDLIHDRNSLSESTRRIFAEWRDTHATLKVSLVLGNHDRHVHSFPPEWNLEIVQGLDFDSIHCCHDVARLSNDDGQFLMGGHLHPVVHVGSAADRIRCRCFVVGPRSLILPAFGPFKGGLLQSKKDGVRIFPIAEGKIWCNEPSQAG